MSEILNEVWVTICLGQAGFLSFIVTDSCNSCIINGCLSWEGFLSFIMTDSCNCCINGHRSKEILIPLFNHNHDWHLSQVFDNSITQGSTSGDSSRNGEGQGPDLRAQGSLDKEDVLQELSMNWLAHCLEFYLLLLRSLITSTTFLSRWTELWYRLHNGVSQIQR